MMNGKLSYYYGTMGAAKSANLLMKKFQYERNGAICILAKPKKDTRNEEVIYSRIGVQEKCILIDAKDNLVEKMMNITEIKEYYEDITKQQINVVLLIDEVQFLTREQIKQLWILSNYHGIIVYCFGLKTSYNNRLFEAASELLAIVDPKNVHAIDSPCQRCNGEATTHLRLVNGNPVFGDEDEIVGDIVGVERYESVCQHCYDVAKRFNK